MGAAPEMTVVERIVDGLPGCCSCCLAAVLLAAPRLLVPCPGRVPPACAAVSGQVISVTDGDTLLVLIEKCLQKRVFNA